MLGMPTRQFPKRLSVLGCILSVGVLVSACTGPVHAPHEPMPQIVTPADCMAPAADEEVIGNWLNKRQEKGVTGELRTLFTLKADGSMLFTEQLKRPRQPSQGINESGCWVRTGDQIILHTYQSNGVPVDIEDPIYTNRYRIISVDEESLVLQSEAGQQLATQRTSPGYRLPF